MIAALVMTLTLAVSDPAGSARVEVPMTANYDLSFVPPVGCVWDGESSLECESAWVYFGGYEPPRASWFSDFDAWFRENARRTRRAHGKIVSERLTIDGLPAGTLHYTGVRRLLVIELLIGVPADPLGHVFAVIAEEARAGSGVETLYRQLVKSFEVVPRQSPPD